jgi:hypothetical protein
MPSRASSHLEEASIEKIAGAPAAMRILMILIPERGAPGSQSDPAVRLERAAGPYYAFRDADVEVVLASSGGGMPLMEMASGSASTEVMRRLKQDQLATDEFSDTVSLDRVYAEDFDAAFCVGLPDAIWRPTHECSAGALISRLLDAGKPVAVMPSGIDLAPKGTGEGLLIVGDGSKSSVPAAQALMGVVRQLQIKSEGKAP